jgi:zona occludens toxin
MAIEAYVGLPGHGKSYGVVEHVIIPSIKEGRHVVTNIPLQCDDLIADFGGPGAQITQLPEDWFEREDMGDFIPPGSVAVLDELWRRWPAGLKANNALLADKSLLAEHRHRVDDKGRSMRIVLVTQDLSQIASWVRILVEQTYKMTKLTAIGSTKKFRVDIYLGAPTGQNIPKSRLIRQTFGQYRKEIYRYYSSATQSATGNVGDESKADKRGTIWRSPLIIFSIVGPLTLGPLLVWWLYGYFMSGFGMVENVESELPETQPAESLALVNPPPPSLASSALPSPASLSVQPLAKPSNSSVWRVAGYIARGQGKGTERSAWPSYTGYGSIQADIPQADPLPDLVVLQSDIYGLRYELASACELLPDRKSHMCHIDGAIVTPWTGRGDSTQWASDPVRLAGRTASVASGATERSGTASPNANPQPPSAERL